MAAAPATTAVPARKPMPTHFSARLAPELGSVLDLAAASAAELSFVPSPIPSALAPLIIRRKLSREGASARPAFNSAAATGSDPL
jgi:hypothetical protein